MSRITFLILVFLGFQLVRAQTEADMQRQPEAFYAKDTEAGYRELPSLYQDIQEFMSQTAARDYTVEVLNPGANQRQYRVYFFMEPQAGDLPAKDSPGWYVLNPSPKPKDIHLSERKIQIKPFSAVFFPYSLYPKIDIRTGGLLGTRLRYVPRPGEGSKYFIAEGAGIAGASQSGTLGLQNGDFKPLTPQEAHFYLKIVKLEDSVYR